MEHTQEELAILEDSICGYCGEQLINGRCSRCSAIHFPMQVNAIIFKGELKLVEPFMAANPVF
jgi:hypothetical protein